MAYIECLFNVNKSVIQISSGFAAFYSMTSVLAVMSVLLSVIRMSSGLGAISNARKPSTSSISFDVNFATNLAVPTKFGLYAKRVSAKVCGGTSGT